MLASELFQVEVVTVVLCSYNRALFLQQSAELPSAVTSLAAAVHVLYLSEYVGLLLTTSGRIAVPLQTTPLTPKGCLSYAERYRT
jgi:hypothetical protein